MTDRAGAEGDLVAEESVRVIGPLDLDRPLFRIFPLWFFEYALRVNGGCLVLVPPRVWEDPYEDVCSKIQMQAPDGAQGSLAEYLKPTYAQCWSFEGASDALLRAYSRVSRDPHTSRNMEPRYEGVQVRTTPRKLIKALDMFAHTRREQNQGKELNFRFYLGAVRYVDDVAQRMINGLATVGPVAIGDGEDRAMTLLYKRPAFSHEAEVRIIMVADEPASWPTFPVDIDPNNVFEEVRFDPRLAMFETNERERMARDLGYEGPFGKTETYEGAFFLVPLPRHWDEISGEIRK